MIGEKSKEKLREFVQEFFKNSPTNKEGIVLEMEMLDQIGDSLIKDSNRLLFDFFDRQGLFINISGSDDWTYGINENSYQDQFNNSRKEAEKEAFEQAFKLLENGGN